MSEKKRSDNDKGEAVRSNDVGTEEWDDERKSLESDIKHRKNNSEESRYQEQSVEVSRNEKR